MKVVYCHCSVYNPGGMERVLLNKVRWICENRPEWEVVVVTTDQQGRAPFYEFPAQVRMVDLGINYSLDKEKPLFKRIPSYLRKCRMHRRRLAELLMQERPDVTVSLYPSESSFIPAIKDGSKKVLELHFNRFFRLQYGRKGLTGLIDRRRSRQDERIARSFDSFVVLTEEDKGYWGNMPNISVIANAVPAITMHSECSAKRVIAVGRLDYQKGFDRLVKIWEIVKRDPIAKDWNLDIYGQGEWREMLLAMIAERGLQDSLHINKPTDKIEQEYANSSIIAMTSYYEGFGMVLVEAMSCGVPAFAFDCKCGPRDIIRDGVTGRIVADGDTEGFAEALLGVMRDGERRAAMGARATEVRGRFSEAAVMARWMALFDSLTGKK